MEQRMPIRIVFKSLPPGSGVETEIAVRRVSDVAEVPAVGQIVSLQSKEGDLRGYRVVNRRPTDTVYIAQRGGMTEEILLIVEDVEE